MIGTMAMMGAQAFLGAQKAGDASMKQFTQQTWANHQQQLQVNQKNRDIAAANAQRWAQNTAISEDAWANETEQQYYLRLNYDNETGALSRKTQETNANLTALLSGRSLKGQSARMLMKSQQSQQRDMYAARGISYANQSESLKRQKEQALSQRNYGYNRHMTFVPAANFNDPSSAYKSALVSGLISTGMSGFTAYKSDSLEAKKQAFRDVQTKWYESQ